MRRKPRRESQWMERSSEAELSGLIIASMGDSAMTRLQTPPRDRRTKERLLISIRIYQSRAALRVALYPCTDSVQDTVESEVECVANAFT